MVQTNVLKAAGDASMLNRVSPGAHCPGCGTSALPSTSPRRSAVPTVVLVHGAFADASSWCDVIVELQSTGISVLAPPNPLRSLDGDAAYVAERVRQIDRPVLLVGHSYGGAVITVAGAVAHNVVGLVYIAAFIPDVGECLAEIGAPFPQSRLDEVVRQNTFPLDGTRETAVELSIAPEEYPAFFLPGSQPEAAAAAAVSQRPLAASALSSTGRRLRPGERCPPGPSSLPVTSRSTRTPSASWPSAPQRRRSRFPDRTP